MRYKSKLTRLDLDVSVLIPEADAQAIRDPSRFNKMNPDWLTFAFSDLGLLYTILLTASCSILQKYDDYSGPLARKAMSYKGYCIRAIINAISEQDKSISHQTMSLAMVLCAHEVNHNKFADMIERMLIDNIDQLW
jgi:hypothetical protein